MQYFNKKKKMAKKKNSRKTCLYFLQLFDEIKLKQ